MTSTDPNVLALQATLQGDPATGVLSYVQVLDHVKETVPKVPQIQQAVQGLESRVTVLETTLEPVLTKADAEITSLKTQSDAIRTVVNKEWES